MEHSGQRRRPDSAPWDPAVSLQVGVVVGALLGALLVLITGIANVGMVAVPAVLGGLLGWLSQRRKQRP